MDQKLNGGTGVTAASGPSLADGIGPSVATPGGGMPARTGQTVYTQGPGLGEAQMNPNHGGPRAPGSLSRG